MEIRESLYKFLKLIPKNKVITYKTLSDIFSIQPRVVAKILSKNENQDIYPCYKVIESSGKLGGYNLGIEEKIKRLEKNGIKIINGKVPVKFFWKPKL